MRYDVCNPVKVIAVCTGFCVFVWSGASCDITNEATSIRTGSENAGQVGVEKEGDGIKNGRGLRSNGPSTVEIVQTERGYQILRNGQPYFVKGAGGSRYPDKLAEAGGNSVRSWTSSGAILDRAHENGLSVLLGIRLGKPRQGFDYSDTERVGRQLERVRRTVMKYKDHPALLMWGVGNEVEHHASAKDRIKVWRAINDIAQIIKQVDGNHPVITVIAGLGSDNSTSGMKMVDIQEHCPAIDAVGINIYGTISSVPAEVARQGWDKPYLITEFGPRGWWEVDRTAWGLPIEDTSTIKAKFYLKGYLQAIEGRSNCLGSYVFLWGNKQEKTHTWFGMFLPDGTPTETVDAMTQAWTGQWPANRAPRIGPGKVAVHLEKPTTNNSKHIFPAGSQLFCAVDAVDPEGGALTVKWDLRLDVSDNPSTGGDREPSTSPIEGAILSAEGNKAVIRVPKEEANYRIFVYVYDASGKVATVNVPIAGRKPK